MVGSVFQPKKTQFLVLSSILYTIAAQLKGYLHSMSLFWHAMPNAWTRTYSELVKQHCYIQH